MAYWGYPENDQIQDLTPGVIVNDKLLLVSIIFFISVLFLPLPSASQSNEDVNRLIGQYNQLYREGRYLEALPAAKEILAICERSLGPEHPNTATALNNLAELYRSMGDYAKAVPLHRRAIEIKEKALGPDHPSTAISLNNLARLYAAMGDYAKAEPLYKRSLAIKEKTLGPDHPSTAISLNNLALLYDAIGDYAKAEPLYKRSLAIKEKALGPDHPETATSLNNLAMLYNDMGDYAKAEPLFIRSLAIREKALGPDHRDTAQSLNNLALFYRNTGNLAKAEPLYKRSLVIWEKMLGPDHPYTATSLNNLAALYRSMGDYAKAEPLYKRSLVIWEKTSTPENPLINLALLYAATGRYAEALPLMLRAQSIDTGLIDQVMGFTSENQKMKFLATKENDLYVFLSFVSRHMKDKKDIIEKAFTVWLQRKGVVLEAQKRFLDALVFSDDPEVQRKFQELARVRSQLSKLTFSGPGSEGPEAYRKNIGELGSQKERLEAELSKLSNAFARTKKTAKADTKQVAAALPKGSALIDFIKLPTFNFTAKGRERKWASPRYYAFILLSGDASDTSLIDLGDAGETDRLIGEFKRNIGNYQGDPGGKEASRISGKLYDRIFLPLVNDLKGTKDIYLSPDGNLNIIPFEVLKGPDGRYLIEDYTFNYLGTGRDILGFGMVKGKPSKPLIIGDPDYDLDEAGVKSSLSRLGMISSGKGSSTTRSRDMSIQGFSPLPGTREEAESIAALLGMKNASLYTGKDALEEVLMGYANPVILHLATHGFFLTDQDLLDENKKTPYEDPLIRSGIVLAGVNRSIRSGSDEGLVTAEKILSLRLHGTDLVVLSACETGLGDIKNGEGVFGLRRAFTQAGTKGLVMSMWSVPDRETKELMVNFYTNILVKKMKRPEALRQAVLTELAEVKKRHGTTNPFFWGAFVYMGEP